MANIWLINQYATTPQTGIGGRHHQFAKLLAKRGHRVTVIAARDHHMLNNREVSRKYPRLERVDGYDFLRLKVPHYTNGHSKWRVVTWFVFAFQLWLLSAKEGEKPDAILYSSLSLPGYLAAERLARKFGTRLIFEVRDIWPLSAIELGQFKTTHPFIRFLQRVEDRAYANSDEVIGVLPKLDEHLKNRGLGYVKLSWVPNGVSMDDPANQEELASTIANQFPVGKFIVGYLGTHGLANSLDTLIDAANRLKNNKGIAFILIGNGNEKQNLMARTKKLKLKNVVFIDPIQKSQVQAALAMCDACVLCWHDTPIYRFGISANKLADYLASGKPVLHAYSGGCDPVSSNNAGIQVQAQNPEELADAISKLKNMTPDARAQMGKNGHDLARSAYNYSELVDQYEKCLLGDLV